MIYQDEVLEMIQNGIEAFEIINEVDKNFGKRFYSIDKNIKKLLNDIRKYFPDAEYYTASGGFNLLLGRPHSNYGDPQQELVAFHGTSSIGDGDF